MSVHCFLQGRCRPVAGLVKPVGAIGPTSGDMHQFLPVVANRRAEADLDVGTG
ncbi:MAG TPA: hypothetical protein VI074_01350 [Propionibacteriaceae bacterium]